MRMVFLAALSVFSTLSLAEARGVEGTISVRLDGLFTAGNFHYLTDDYVVGELDRQIKDLCGTGVLLELDVRYRVEQVAGTDSSNARLEGQVRCLR